MSGNLTGTMEALFNLSYKNIEPLTSAGLGAAADAYDKFAMTHPAPGKGLCTQIQWCYNKKVYGKDA